MRGKPDTGTGSSLDVVRSLGIPGDRYVVGRPTRLSPPSPEITGCRLSIGLFGPVCGSFGGVAGGVAGGFISGTGVPGFLGSYMLADSSDKGLEVLSNDCLGSEGPIGGFFTEEALGQGCFLWHSVQYNRNREIASRGINAYWSATCNKTPS